MLFRSDDSITLPEHLVAKHIYRLPIIKTAIQEVGKEIVANIVALGLIVRLTGIVSDESLEKAILSRIPKGTEDLNKLALKKGYELAESLTV